MPGGWTRNAPADKLYKDNLAGKGTRLADTPLRRQYLQIKKQYPDAIVFFRLGDFYETFDDDASIVSRVCDVVLEFYAR